MKKHSIELRKKRLEKKIKNILFFKIFPSVFLFSIFVLFFNSDYLSIKKNDIDIKNKKYLDQKKIDEIVNSILNEKYYNIFSKKNYLFYPKNEIKNKLKDNFKELKSVEIKNGDYFNNIILNLEEEKRNYIFCKSKKESQCFEVSSEGFIFKKIKYKTSSNLILISNNYNLGDNFFESQKKKEKIFEIINFLNNIKKEKVVFLSKPDNYFYILELKNNLKIIIRSNFKKDDIILKINKFFSKIKYKNLSYINFTLKNRISYCEKGEICEKNFK